MLLPFSTKDGLSDVIDHNLKAKEFELFVEPSQTKLQQSYICTLYLWQVARSPWMMSKL